MGRKHRNKNKNTNKKFEVVSCPKIESNEQFVETEEFVKICKMTQKELKVFLVAELLKCGYTTVINSDGFVYAKGTVPILLTAHMDTVHKEKVGTVVQMLDEDGNIVISSPQGIGGDDRCGIYMILQIVKESKCSVLFCEDEEIGCVGSKKFTKTGFIKEISELKYCIELDRANGDDAVFYDCDNKEFTDFILENSGYRLAYGSYTDISEICPVSKVAGVNFSCGYYNPHTLKEYVVFEEMIATMEMVKKLVQVECEQFEYIEKKYTYYGGRFCRNAWSYYDDYDDYDYGYGSYKYSNQYNSKSSKLDDYFFLEVMYKYVTDSNGEPKELEDIEIVEGESEDACWGNFFRSNGDVCYNDVLDYQLYTEDEYYNTYGEI